MTLHAMCTAKCSCPSEVSAPQLHLFLGRLAPQEGLVRRLRRAAVLGCIREGEVADGRQVAQRVAQERLRARRGLLSLHFELTAVAAEICWKQCN